MSHLTVPRGQLSCGLSVEETELEGFAQDHAAGGWQGGIHPRVSPALSAGMGTGAATMATCLPEGGWVRADWGDRSAAARSLPLTGGGKFPLGAAVEGPGEPGQGACF